MGLLSAIGRLFKKMFRAIMKFLKKFWPIIAIFLIVISIYFPGVWGMMGTWLGSAASSVVAGAQALFGWYSGLFSGLTIGEGLALALGTAFVLAPEETGEIVKDVITGVGDAAGGAIGGGISGLVNGIVSSPLALLGIGIGLYLWLGRGKDDSTPIVIDNSPRTSDERTPKARALEANRREATAKKENRRGETITELMAD